MMQAARIYLTILFIFCTWPLLGQNPLVGTWERTTDSIRSVKIITPTHWMVFIESFQGDASKFEMAHGGSYTLTGNKYVEHIDVASWPEPRKAKTDFVYYEAGDYTFVQKGTVTLGDGTIIPIDETWQRVTGAKANAGFPAIGTWNRLSFSTVKGGKKEVYTRATAACFEIITPTHWMRISHQNGRFEHASGGTYTATGNKAFPKVEFASFPTNQNEKIEAIQKVTGNKRYNTVVITGPDGKKIAAYEEVLEKVNAKPQVTNTDVRK